MTGQDQLMKMLQNKNHEEIAFDSSVKRYENKIGNHEKRLKILEAHPA